jgi:hypothetical protein
MPVLARYLAASFVAFSVSLLLFAGPAGAQIPEPPSTIAGSITDAGGPVPAGVQVEAIVNNRICGTTQTVYTGEGAARVTVYVVDVASESQTEGCGKPGDAVRLRIGDRLAPRAVAWEQGLVLFDIVFGDATPAPIPTFTPVGGAAPQTALPSTEETPAPGTDATPEGQQPDGTPADSDDSASPESTPTPTLEGQLTSTTPGVPGTGGGSSNGGFPVWAVLMLVIGGIAAIGGGIGYAMARSTAPAAAFDSGEVIGGDAGDFEIGGEGDRIG